MKTQVPAKKADGGVGVRSYLPTLSRISPEAASNSSNQADLERSVSHPDGYSLTNIPISAKPRGNSQHITNQGSISSLPIQAKLMIGQPNDKYEQEADRVAQQVVEQISSPGTNKPKQKREVQHDAEPEAARKLHTKPLIQCKSGEGGIETPSALESSIQRLQGSGQPLSSLVLQPMEKSFGSNFGKVRVHIDDEADQLNQAIQAKAFTHRQDIYFRKGVYDPSSRAGQELIAHELTHVVQQKGRAVMQKPTFVNTNSGLSNDIIMRKVEDLGYDKSPPKDTIHGVIRNLGWHNLIKADAEYIRTLELVRPLSASAKLTKSTSTGRYKEKPPVFEHVSVFGKWEYEAVGSMNVDKVVDVGHLLADEFFDDDQKPLAYTANNLAPQDSKWNEQGSRKLAETSAGFDVGNSPKQKKTPAEKVKKKPPAEKGKAQKGVQYDVSLEYKPSEWSLKLGDLIDLGVILVKPGKDMEVDKIRDQVLKVPRRMPSNWSIKTTPIDDGELRVNPPHLYPTALPDEFYTPSNSFTVEEKSNSPKVREVVGRQGPLFEDAERKRNPLQYGLSSAFRTTPKQKQRGQRRFRQGGGAKIITHFNKWIINIRDLTNTSGEPFYDRTKIAIMHSDSLTDLTSMLTTGYPMKVQDVMRYLVMRAEEAGIHSDHIEKLYSSSEKTEQMQIDEVISEDEDEKAEVHF